jgi:orotidine-5'-phosphate decarboxylase
VSSFKPQIAYFAAHRAEGQLERLMEHMRRVAPQVPIILDAKRGDIGSTAEQYAKEAFERYGADAVTLSPFMGWDSVAPYLKYEGKGAFLLCRTSNPGGDDLQNQRLASVDGQPLLYEHVARLAQGPWNLNGQLGLVVGATYPAEIERVRQLAPTVPLLIPGVGAQGGDAPTKYDRDVFHVHVPVWLIVLAVLITCCILSGCCVAQHSQLVRAHPRRAQRNRLRR